jgi:hypothetical protein
VNAKSQAPNPEPLSPNPDLWIPVFPYVIDGKAHGHEGSYRGYPLTVASGDGQAYLLGRQKVDIGNSGS